MNTLHRKNFPYQIYAGFAGMTVFWVYVQTLAPTVSFFDSGELIAAAYTLGVAHPPGYPLYVSLGWLFSKLPIGAGAYRLNLMSACFATLAALMVFLITHAMLSNRSSSPVAEPSRTAPDPEQMFMPVASLVAAFAFAFSQTHWSQALIAEVYSLNAFWCGMIIWLLFHWRRAVGEQEAKAGSSRLHSMSGSRAAEQNRDDTSGGNAAKPPREKHHIPHAGHLYLIAFLFGIGFGNHQTISLFFFAACFLVLKTTPHLVVNMKAVALILASLALGLSIYALTPIRAAQHPPVNWGNPSTWRQFKWLVTREGYSNVPRGGGLSALWHAVRTQEVREHDARPGQSPLPERPVHGLTRLLTVFRQSLFFRQMLTFRPWREFGQIGLILAIVGLLYGVIFVRIPTLTVFIAICSFVVLTIFISDPPDENIFLVEEFHTPAYLLTAVLIGLGVMGLARAMLWVVRPWRFAQYGIVFFLTINALILPGRLLLVNLPHIDRSRNYVAYDYASNVLSSLQPHAILFTWGDSGAFPLWYLQIVEKQRQDVILIHVPHLSSPWYADSLPEELRQAVEFDRIHLGSSLEAVDNIIRTQIAMRPIYFDFSSAHSLPLSYQLLPHGITYKVAAAGDTIQEEIWNRYRFRGILDNTRIAMDADIERTFGMYGSARVELGHYYLEMDELEKAAEQFNAAVQFDPDLGDHIVQHLHFRNKLAGDKPAPSP